MQYTTTAVGRGAKVFAIMLLGAGSATACMQLEESPFDTSTALGLALQALYARQPIALGQFHTRTVFQSERGLSRPVRIAIHGNTMYLSDQNSERVLGYVGVPSENHAPAQIALGVRDPATVHAQVINPPATDQRGFSAPIGVATDGTRLFVADMNLHRVHIWNQLPGASFLPADLVLGQADFSGNMSNRGAATGAGTLSQPTGISTCNGKLFVADTGNNRVLVWNTIPTTNGQAADAALGQANLTGNGVGTTAVSMSAPEDVYCDGTRLYVADSSNNRVIIFNTIPSVSGASANVAVGQPNLASGGLATTSTGMNRPKGVFGRPGGPLVVGDTINNRVLIFDSIPTTDGVAANRVYGQPDFVSNTANNGGPRLGLNEPEGVALDGSGRLFAVEKVNNRVAVWSGTALGTQPQITYVLGQPTPSETPTVWNSGTNNFFVKSPVAIGFAGNNLVAVSPLEHRLPIWSRVPYRLTETFGAAFGQSTTSTNLCNQPGINAQSVCAPQGYCANSTHTFVSDGSNHRILVFTGTLTAQSTASFVLGQAAFTANANNAGGGTAANSLSSPQGLFCNDSQLFAADTNNNRVLIWNLPITAMQQAANVVVGQPNMTSGAAVTASTGLNGPVGVSVDQNRLLIADASNSRVLIFNSVPTTDGQAASIVLGQADFTTSTENTGGVSAARMFRPFSARVLSGQLVVADTLNSRFLIWKSFPTTNGQAADRVFGQPNFTENLPNYGGIGPYSVNVPADFTVSGDRVLIADYFNNRILLVEQDEFLSP